MALSLLRTLVTLLSVGAGEHGIETGWPQATPPPPGALQPSEKGKLLNPFQLTEHILNPFQSIKAHSQPVSIHPSTFSTLFQSLCAHSQPISIHTSTVSVHFNSSRHILNPLKSNRAHSQPVSILSSIFSTRLNSSQHIPVLIPPSTFSTRFIPFKHILNPFQSLQKHSQPNSIQYLQTHYQPI